MKLSPTFLTASFFLAVLIQTICSIHYLKRNIIFVSLRRYTYIFWNRKIIIFLIIFQYQPSDFDLRDDNHGVMVRTFNNLFDKIRALNNEEEFCKIKASYLEIYNEKTIDLLNHGSKRMNLPLRWNKQNQAFNVENLFVFSCTETQDLVNILLEGTKNRALGSHRFVFHIHERANFSSLN